MTDEHINVIDDREWHTLHGAARYRRLFFDRIFPWLLFAGIIFGLYLSINYGLEALILLSEPLAEGMKAMGL